MNSPKLTNLNWRALADLCTVMLILVLVKHVALGFSTLCAGPISTFLGMIVATYLLQRRAESWSGLGLVWPRNWLKTLALTVLTFIAVALAANIAKSFVGEVVSSGRFDHVEGDLVAYLIVMLLVWTHGSFFEELLFRAFIISKAGQFLGGSPWAMGLVLLFASLFFGYRHYYYQGFEGAVITGVIGFTFGLLYLCFGRKNILPLILAHGVINSLSQTTRFLGTGFD